MYYLLTNPTEVPQAANLRQQRITAGISLTAAAHHLGTTTMRLSRLERGVLHHAELATTYQHWLTTNNQKPLDTHRSIQGRAMARWTDIEHALGTPISFADPHASWQRPVNEDLNGLVRRWLAKSTDLSTYSQTDLDAVARRINHMPRRSLSRATPTATTTMPSSPWPDETAPCQVARTAQ